MDNPLYLLATVFVHLIPLVAITVSISGCYAKKKVEESQRDEEDSNVKSAEDYSLKETATKDHEAEHKSAPANGERKLPAWSSKEVEEEAPKALYLRLPEPPAAPAVAVQETSDEKRQDSGELFYPNYQTLMGIVGGIPGSPPQPAYRGTVKPGNDTSTQLKPIAGQDPGPPKHASGPDTPDRHLHTLGRLNPMLYEIYDKPIKDDDAKTAEKHYGIGGYR